ncbi:hypothetical protein Swit_4456 [Rhizorhabdus wittichii RW1]|uniref:Uncharacterized protein n=1 Tax=Rhizorhabdus wittichii (strain DSM 6014 / CCUG 31198 / JCM 15750 / NBRC 105917 / EY 4224 / RW1) TaxID=392499 RepID=A0A9J9HG10_RHIWR|nr:hypothetical protein Swit_4456 [Rhizorhabdus wittichii RW1]
MPASSPEAAMFEHVTSRPREMTATFNGPLRLRQGARSPPCDPDRRHHPILPILISSGAGLVIGPFFMEARMALSTYSELVASLAAWLDGSDLGGRERDFITLCEDEINARLAAAVGQGAVIRPMMVVDPLTIDAELVDLPDGDTVKPISIELSGLDRPWSLDYVSPERLVGLRFGEAEQRSAMRAVIDGDPPRFYTVIGDQLRFHPAPEGSFGATIARFVKIPALSDAMPTNWVLASHRNAYLYGSLAQAEMFGWNDSGTANWAELFGNAMDGLIARYPVQSNQAPLTADLTAFGRGGGLSYAGFIGGAF